MNNKDDVCSIDEEIKQYDPVGWKLNEILDPKKTSSAIKKTLEKSSSKPMSAAVYNGKRRLTSARGS